MMKKATSILLFVLIAIFLAGCVSKKKFEALEKEVDVLIEENEKIIEYLEYISSIEDYLANEAGASGGGEYEDRDDGPPEINVSNSVSGSGPAIDNLNFPEFNYPPPHYSKIKEFSLHDIFLHPNSFGDVDSELKSILIKSGFVNSNQEDMFKYFQIKMNGQFKGYAVVTNFEKIDKNGKYQVDRFDTSVNKKEKKSLMDYIFPTKLNNGYFRFFAFLITDDYYGDREERLSKNESLTANETGANTLHPMIESRTLTPNVKLHVLVYEFDQLESETDGKPAKFDELSVEDHLSEAGIWKYFKTD